MAARKVLGDRHARRVAVHCRAAGKYQRPAADGLHGLQQAHRAADVVAVILERVGHTLTDGLVAREVHDTADIVSAQHVLDERRVQHIALFALDVLLGDGIQPLQHTTMAVGKIVQDDGRVARFGKRQVGVAADIAGAAREENVHARIGTVMGSGGF